MVTMLIVKCNESQRAEMKQALAATHCEIEAQEWVDGSTAWGFMVACFIEHASTDTLHKALRDAGFNGYLKVVPMPANGSFK